MNYADPVFFVFFGATFVLYYSLQDCRLQSLLLVAASLFFYAWEAPEILSVFLCSWLITGLTSRAVMRTTDSRRARLAAVSGVVANLGLLGFFKYKFLFFRPESESAARSFGEWLLLAPLPIGIWPRRAARQLRPNNRAADATKKSAGNRCRRASAAEARDRGCAL
jgi:D-alanyl-lipoteichoic acid acyltransferase DltB (MBOAT superfamily)